MGISRRSLLAAGGTIAVAGPPAKAAARPPSPKTMVIFDKGFQNGWSNVGWAHIEQPVPFDGHTTLKVEGGPWSALAFRHAALSMADFSTLTFLLNGGDSGGFTMWLRGFRDGKAIDCDFQVKPVAKSWTRIEAPLAALKIDGQTIDSFVLQAPDITYKPYYVAKVQLE
jgi:hypothetical protein